MFHHSYYDDGARVKWSLSSDRWRFESIPTQLRGYFQHSSRPVYQGTGVTISRSGESREHLKISIALFQTRARQVRWYLGTSECHPSDPRIFMGLTSIPHHTSSIHQYSRGIRIPARNSFWLRGRNELSGQLSVGLRST